MYLNRLIVLSITLIIMFSLSSNLNAQKEPFVAPLLNCSVPQSMVDEIKKGVQFALDKKAAFAVNDADLNHVHLLVTRSHYQEIIDGGSIKIFELMESSDAMLFHSQEESYLRDNFPVEIRKRRNLLYNLRSGEVDIINVDRYNTDARYFTVFHDKHLGLVEIFQISFYQLPIFVNKPCKLPFFKIFPPDGRRAYRIVISEMMMAFSPWTNKGCFCSGAVQDR